MLKPSQRRALNDADLIVWVGENVEGFLPRVLATSGKQGDALALMTLDGIKLLQARAGGEWQALAEHRHGHHHDHGHDNETDGHLWLDPQNAKFIVMAVADRLAKLDIDNAARYSTNANQLLERLDALDAELKFRLKPIVESPYLVFHDAYQYFEEHYDLNAMGAVSVDPDRKPGARRLKEIRNTIHKHNVQCVFNEPQFPGNVIAVVIEGSHVRRAELDPMGSELSLGSDLYFSLMRNLGDGLVHCLTNE
ncbi:zinc ABC transporter substrate-binding protein [Pseudomonadota bacterium]